MVTKVLVGFLKKSSVNLGMTSMVSGKFFSKKAVTDSLSFRDSNEFSPSKGINNVPVKLPSKLGNAINMYSRRGQI